MFITSFFVFFLGGRGSKGVKRRVTYTHAADLSLVLVMVEVNPHHIFLQNTRDKFLVGGENEFSLSQSCTLG